MFAGNMKTITTVLLMVLLQGVCFATSFIRIRLEVHDEAERYVLNDRPIEADKLAEIMDKLARIDTNQFILVQISKPTKASQMIATLEMLRSRGLHNVAVYPLDGVSTIAATNKYSFTLIPNEAVDTTDFERQLQMLEDIPEIETIGEPAAGPYGSPAAGSPSGQP